MKRYLVLVALTLLVGLAWAGTAAAQVAFHISASSRTIRSEGLTEAVGPVTLTVTTGGTIKAKSAIFLQYGPEPIVNMDVTGGIDGSPVGPGDPVDCFNSDGTQFPACPSNVVTGDSDTVLPNDTIEIEFESDTVFTIGQKIVVTQARIDATSLSCGDKETVSAFAVPNPVFASTNPITFDGTGPFTVAQLSAAGSDGTAGGCKSLQFTVLKPAQLRTCLTKGSDFEVEITENFREALTSISDEVGLSNFPPPNNGSNFTVKFSGIPQGIDIHFDGQGETTNGPASVAEGTIGGIADDGNCGATPCFATFTFSLNPGDNTSEQFAIELFFTLSDNGIADPTAAAGATVSVSLVPNPPESAIVLFDTNLSSQPVGAGSVDVDTDSPTKVAFQVASCRTNLLFPFVANTLGFDTGIAIANTSDSPWTDTALIAHTIIGPGSTDKEPVAEPPSQEHGNCILNLFPSTPGGFAGSPVASPPIAGTTPDIPAGGTWADNLSDPAGPFGGKQGYIIAVCDFEFAHGFAFITAPFPNPGTLAIAEGYLALVIPDPTVIESRTVFTRQVTPDGSKNVPTGEGLLQ